jgi:hypothetical protein
MFVLNIRRVEFRLRAATFRRCAINSVDWPVIA